MTWDEVVALRQSTRAFAQVMPSEEAVGRIVRAGRMAPISMHRNASYYIAVLRDPQVIDTWRAEFRAKVKDADPFYGAPVLFVVAGSTDIESTMRAADAACIVDHMLLAATAEGLGSVFICGAVRTLGETADYISRLALPAGMTPIAAAAVGEPESPLHPRDVSEIGTNWQDK